jgi:hypothetical protein
MSVKESARPIKKTIVTQVFRAWHSVDAKAGFGRSKEIAK